jgi:hypothetical protein
MANKRSFCFIIAFHNFVTLENQVTYQCPSSWPVVITMKKKLAGTWKKIYRILVGPNEWQQDCNRSNPEKTGRSCERPECSWLSSRVSRTLPQKLPCRRNFTARTYNFISRMIRAWLELSCPDHIRISVRFQLWNHWGWCWEIDASPSLFKLLQPKMPTDDVKNWWAWSAPLLHTYTLH